MKFKKYIKESVEPKLTLDEGFTNPDADFMQASPIDVELDNVYGDVDKMIANGEYEAARAELDQLTKELDEFEAENNKKKIFKFPATMFTAQRRQLTARYNKLPVTESIEDMDRRCENCNTLLTDAGNCPKCDDGLEIPAEEVNESVVEELSNKEKLKRAYPELNFDKPHEEVMESCEVNEELSNKEKLLRAYPELNFDNAPENEIIEAVEETPCEDSSCEADVVESYDDYDDDYDFDDDDVEIDRRHAALYGGDRMYCNCGAKLSMNEYGSYCPKCEPVDPEEAYEDSDHFYDDEI